MRLVIVGTAIGAPTLRDGRLILRRGLILCCRAYRRAGHRKGAECREQSNVLQLERSQEPQRLCCEAAKMLSWLARHASRTERERVMNGIVLVSFFKEAWAAGVSNRIT